MNRECKYVDRVFANGGLGRLLFCKRKEQLANNMNPVKRFFMALTGRFLCSCPDCFKEEK